MWSTSVAGIRSPNLAHSRQNGSRRSCSGRRCLAKIGRRYHLLQSTLSGLRWPLRFGRCFGHHVSRVTAGHPACAHGRKGFKATGYHLRTNKKRLNHNTASDVVGSGAKAQALRIDIDDGGLLALFAVHRQPFGRGVRQQLLIGSAATAGAEQKPVLRIQFTTVSRCLQYFRLHFFRAPQRINITPSQKIAPGNVPFLGARYST